MAQQSQSVDVSRLPTHMQSKARRYVEEGARVGGFLTAVLCNDFKQAVTNADGGNRAALHDWALWLHNDVPQSAWGSEEAMRAWQDQGGLQGL